LLRKALQRCRSKRYFLLVRKIHNLLRIIYFC